MNNIQSGDIVTWRPKATVNGPMPLGIANCEVLSVGETATRDPAALIQLPAGMTCEGCPDGVVGALVSDLHVE